MKSFLAVFGCGAMTLLGGCILVYDPGSFEIAGGGGGTGGTGGGEGGAGGGGSECSPQDKLNGQKVNAQADQWTWVSVPDAKCRDGSSTGFAVRIHPGSTRLFLFFYGEGACFNAVSCAESAGSKSFGFQDFDNLKDAGGEVGIFDTTNPENPLRDWSAVFIPYCTGDFHGGVNLGDVPGVGPDNQRFFGFSNVGLYLSRIVPTFPDVTQVLVVGMAAGGFGALYNYDRIARDFCPVPVVLINDSAPPMSDDYNAGCVQERLGELWGVSNSLPADCPAANPLGGGEIVNLITCLGEKYGSSRLGIIASTADDKNRGFYGWGQTGCVGIDSGVAAPAISAEKYAAGLDELRSVYMNKSPAWGSYFVSGTTHTFLGSDLFYTQTVKGVSLTDWVRDMVDGKPAVDVGPQ